MASDKAESVWRGIVCLSLAMRFEKDRVRLGLTAALGRVAKALDDNGLWLEGDDQLLAGVSEGKVSSEQFAEELCSMRRMGIVAKTMH
jgi:hypothetical protein